MKHQNMGRADRTIRTLVALVIAALLIMGKVHGALAIVLGVIAVAFIVTSLFGYCPLYVPMKLSTVKPARPAK